MRGISFEQYALASTVACVGLITHACHQHDALYDILIFLFTSKTSLAVLNNFAFMVALSGCRLMIYVFIGRLRDLEWEELTEAGRGFLMDTILFLILSPPTIDSVEVSTISLIKFTVAVVGLKTLHLIAQIRVAHLFEIGVPRKDVLVRLFCLMAVLLAVDTFILVYFWRLSSKESTFYLWVTFECVGMLSVGCINLLKNSIHSVDLILANGLPQKSAYIFYLELLQDTISVVVYLIFLATFFVFNPSRLPIYMLADMLHAFRNLFVRIVSFQRYLQITRNMDQRFQDATAAELLVADRCIICRDVVTPGAKKLPCGHIFHYDCVKSWFVQQQSCPTCRSEIVIDDVVITPTYPADENTLHETPSLRRAPPSDLDQAVHQSPAINTPPHTHSGHDMRDRHSPPRQTTYLPSRHPPPLNTARWTPGPNRTTARTARRLPKGTGEEEDLNWAVHVSSVPPGRGAAFRFKPGGRIITAESILSSHPYPPPNPSPTAVVGEPSVTKSACATGGEYVRASSIAPVSPRNSELLAKIQHAHVMAEYFHLQSLDCLRQLCELDGARYPTPTANRHPKNS